MENGDKEYEARLRARLRLLHSKMEEGNVRFNAGLEVIESLKMVRTGADGEVDLSTVDARVRSLALVVEGAQQRQDTKGIVSLADLQRGYFDAIQRNFGTLFDDMQSRGATPHQFAMAIARDPEAVESFGPRISEFMEWIDGLWSEAHDIAHIHAEDVGGLKGVFGGEIFPQGRKSIVSTTGVYVDTIVLPDPFLRSRHVLEGEDRVEAVRALLRGGLSLLLYKEAVLADLPQPLAIIVPDVFQFEQFQKEAVTDAAHRAGLKHLNAMFGQTFDGLDAAHDYVLRFETTKDVVNALSDRSKFLFQDGSTEPLDAQLDEYVKKYASTMGVTNPGDATFVHVLSRMGQANDLLMRSGRIGGAPLINASTSWRYLSWALEYGSSTASDTRLHLHMTKALQSATEGEMEWLGDVPLASLIEMRKNNVLPELRNMMSSGVRELIEARPDNFYRSADKVVDNIQRAFDEHRKMLSTLSGKKWRFAGVELASCVVKGAAQIAAAFGVPVVSLVSAALDQAVDVPKFKDIPERVRDLREADRALKRSAVGMLFAAKD